MSNSPRNSVNLSESDQKVEIEKRKLKKATSLTVPGQIVRKLSGTDLRPDIDLLVNSRRSSSSSYEVTSERIAKSFSECGLQVNVIIVDNESFKTKKKPKTLLTIKNMFEHAMFQRSKSSDDSDENNSSNDFHLETTILPKMKSAVTSEIEKVANESSFDLIICLGASSFGTDDAVPDAIAQILDRPAEILQHSFTAELLYRNFDIPFRPKFGTRHKTLIINLMTDEFVLQACLPKGGLFWRQVCKIVLSLREVPDVGAQKHYEPELQHALRPRSYCFP